MDTVIRWAKLDRYDYHIRRSHSKFDGDGLSYVNIYIKVDSRSDPDIADISTDITSKSGMIYLDGLYLGMIDMNMTNPTTLRIRTVEIEKENHHDN